MVQISHPTGPDAFQEHDSAVKHKSRFLGIAPIKYIRTFHGLFHALISTMALLLGNYLLVTQIILGHGGRGVLFEQRRLLFAKKHFFLCNLLSGTITMLFFWNKVQSWQLSTTSMKDKGLVAKQMQNFNRGRGVITPILFSIVPLMLYYDLPASLFSVDQSLVTFSETLICLVILAMAVKTNFSIRDYSKTLFLVYGAYPAGIAATALVYHGGSLPTLFATHPTLLDVYEKNACFTLTCIQYGFFWYYFYSRRFVSKEFVQTACKNYHPIITLLYVIRMTTDRWWSSNLPMYVKVHSFLVTSLVVLFLIKIVKTQLSAARSVKVATGKSPLAKAEEERQQLKSSQQDQSSSSQSSQRRRSSSVFEVEGLRRLSKRRSSLFESVLD